MSVLRHMVLATMIFIPGVLFVGQASAMEMDTDRPGMNYKNFDLLRNHPALCENECMKDVNCMAWTYVKPGIQGSSARCWLKKGIPSPVKNTCCVSGYRSPEFKAPVKMIDKPLKKQEVPFATSRLQFTNQPDLIVSDMHLIEFCKLNFTIKNIGSAGVTKNFTVGVGPPFQPNAHTDKFSPGNLANPGGVQIYTFPDYTFPAMQEMKIVVNPDGSLFEKNYSNNSLTKTGLKCLPDLIITDILTTQDCKIKVIIKNIGIGVLMKWIEINIKGQLFPHYSEIVAPNKINLPGGQMEYISEITLGPQAQNIEAYVYIESNTGNPYAVSKEITTSNNTLNKILSCTQ
jgi:hypothetical protein